MTKCFLSLYSVFSLFVIVFWEKGIEVDLLSGLGLIYKNGLGRIFVKE